jgi:hypothetical protein
MGDQPVARPLPAHRTAQTHNKLTQTPMPQVGFEPTMPVLERAKTVYALDHAATVIGALQPKSDKLNCLRGFHYFLHSCIMPKLRL